MPRGSGSRDLQQLTLDKGKNSADVKLAQRLRKEERKEKSNERKRQKLARDEDFFKPAMEFLSGFRNVTGMPLVPCEPLASIMVIRPD